MANFFRKKKKDDFFENLENDVIKEYSATPDNTHTMRPNALTAEEVNSEKMHIDFTQHEISNPLDSLKKRMKSSQNSLTENKSEISRDDKPLNSSLLERCRPYTLDDEGHDLSKQQLPLYKLESVAEILKSDSERALEELSKKYNLSVDDYTTHKSEVIESPTFEQKSIDERTVVFKQMVNDAKTITGDDQVFEELLSENSNVSITELHTNLPDISDIDNFQKNSDFQNKLPEDTATIRFTPIKDAVSGESHISISSTTRPIDIGHDIEGFEEDMNTSHDTELEQTDFEDFSIKDEYSSTEQTKPLIRKLSFKKRSCFLKIFPSVFSTILLCLFMFGSLNDLIIKNPSSTILICTIILFVNVISNIDIFLGFKTIFSNNCSTDVLVSLSSLCTCVLGVTRIFSDGNENALAIFAVILLTSIILNIRAVATFWDASTLLGNLKQIATTKPKKAVTLILDSATNFAMAKNSIEGDVLAATPINTDFVSDFMKYSKYGVKLKGKLRTLTIVVLILSAFFGIATNLYYSSAVQGLYASACVFCLAASPCLLLIDSLPLLSAAKKLNKKGAMIAGKTGAERLELANAAVVSSADIFPSGTVTLQSIKVLSENNFDDIIMKAASLTETVNSTIAPIFKQIAKTNDAYVLPDSDTVKYEERLGLSGWVDNELLFIGNRTLMEAHGIEVPGIEVDRQILRKGYFPVYLASGGKACALIIIQYMISPEIALQLRRLTNLGVTLLVNNTDPNINENMICDYFGLYEDTVKIISNAGAHMYKNAVSPTNCCSAPAAFRGAPSTFITIMNCASRIKKSNFIISFMYVLSAIIGIVAFIYSTLSGAADMPSAMILIAYETIVTAITILLYLIKKP